jgi:hypothetical protein
MKHPRRLVAVVIDDRKDSIAERDYVDCVKLDKVASYSDIQEKFMPGKRSTRMSMAADLLLIDVNQIESMPGNDGFDLGPRSGVKPLGPLLALPFIARDLCVFAPYSNYWGDDAVTKNGFVMLAVALLLSVGGREKVTLEEAREAVERRATVDTSPQIALIEALRSYRMTLLGKHVQLVDIGRVYQRLIDLQQVSIDTGRNLAMPLSDSEGVLSVDFYAPSGEFDRIELSSLFSDELRFRPVLNPIHLDPVIGALEKWKDKSVEYGGPVLFAAVIGALALCEREGRLIGEAVDEVLRREKSTIDRYLLIRVAMEFAWVQAWHEMLTDHERDNSLIGRVQVILGLRGHGNESVKYRRLLGASVDGKDVVSKEKWRTPFKENYSGTNDAYQLDHNSPGTLTSSERGLCIQFAQDKLRWDGTEWNQEYRSWMMESVELDDN